MKPLKQGHSPKFDRREHEQDVRSYLQKHFSAREWIFSLPRGSGMETYLVQGNGHEYFVKVGAIAERYLVMAEAGLTPPVFLQYAGISDTSTAGPMPAIYLCNFKCYLSW